MENLDLLGIGFRVSIMYLYALALVRLSGKQSISHLTAMDFIMILIIGDLFDDVFWAEVPLVQGLVGFAVIVLVHLLTTYVSSRNTFIHWLMCAPERLVIERGKLVQDNLRREWMRPEAVEFELSLRGEEQLREVKEARLEAQGKVSVIKRPSSKPVQKKDRRRLFR
jgi:uncharacterized membrane protein YcaP (DUF421 family)